MAARILIVDDEPRNLTLLEAYLGPLGHELIRAGGGREALRLYAEHPPDLVLLDYVMPEFDGLDVLTHIRAASASSGRVPVVLVTAHSDRAHRVRGLEAGADEFLEKPIDAPILLARVKTLLSLKASHDALAASKAELERRHQAMEEARREQKELTEFVVHDLKNPLSAVCINLDFACATLGAGDSEVATAIADARTASQRLTTMISDLLAISRIEDATFAVHRESIAVTKLLRSVIHSFVSRARQQGIQLTAPLEEGRDVEIHADRALIMRVLENILDNAFRYTPAQGRIAVGTHSQDGVVICVSNDGPGIPMRQRQHIFEKFRRGDTENATRSNAGLGLYFCKRAIEAHGGAIEVVDSVEFPTSFRISLPNAPAAP